VPRASFRFLVLAAAAVAPLLLGAPTAQAAKLKPQNLTRLIADADQIVVGKVTRVVDGVSARGLPYTEITIAVADSAKGELRGGKTYTFRQFGLLEPRRISANRVLVAVTPEGFPRWQEGEQMVAFLHRPARYTGLQTTAGLAQGKLTMLNGRVVNEFDNQGLFEGVRISDDLLTDKERAMLKGSGPVDAATFLGLVGRAVSENWIARGEMR
jgi:hypothetical protein